MSNGSPWYDPAVVARFSTGVRLYRFLMPVSLIGIGLLFIGLVWLTLAAKPVGPLPVVTVIAGFALVAGPLLIVSMFWNCPNCGADLNLKQNEPSDDIVCPDCSATLFRPGGRYGRRDSPRNPRGKNRNSRHYWVKYRVQDEFRWRLLIFRARRYLYLAALASIVIGLLSDLWFVYLIVGVVSMAAFWLVSEFVWRCSHCGRPLNSRDEHPRRGQVMCHACGAVLWEAEPSAEDVLSPESGSEDAAATLPRRYITDSREFEDVFNRRFKEYSEAVDSRNWSRAGQIMDEIEKEARESIVRWRRGADENRRRRI